MNADETEADEPVPVNAAHAEAAYYHFQQFVLRIPDCIEADLFEVGEDDRLRLLAAPSRQYSRFAHELTHYAQGLATVLGQRIVLNWFALVVTIAQELEGQDPLLVPVWRASGRSKASRRAVEAWNSYMREVTHLVGASLDMRPAGELAGKSPWEFYDYTFSHPVDGSDVPGIALAVPDLASGTLIGVPLQGDAFLEGQAQAVQWLTDGLEDTPEDRLAKRPVDPRPGAKKKDIYYTAIARLVRATLPKWDWLRTTALLCDFALCARTPPMAFVAAYRYLASIEPVPTDELPRLRATLAKDPYETEGRTFIGAKLAERIEDFKCANDGSAARMMGVLTELMVRAWVCRNQDAGYFLGGVHGADWVQRVVQAIGAPPLFLEDVDHARTLTDDELVTKACFWSRGSFDLVREVVAGGLQDECPFLRTRICDWHKEAVCRDGDLLNAPTRDGEGCHVAFAATGLGLYGRAWKRV